MEVLKVAAGSDVNAVAGAITGALEKDGIVEAHAIGAGAVNQAIKAIAIARRFVERHGGRLKVTPGFMDLNIDGSARTGIRLIIER